MAVRSIPAAQTLGTSGVLTRHMRPLMAASTITLFAGVILTAFLLPFVYMVMTAFKDGAQFSAVGAPIWPAREATYTYDGEAYPLYNVPTESGMRQWALIKKGREESSFIDPANAAAGPILWQGKWRTLEAVWEFSPRWDNFPRAWQLIDFPMLLRNTFIIAVIGDIGTLLSCIAVAYGFSRFRIPGKNILFMILIATIILPRQVTLVPTYALFSRIGWTGTWLPLLVPHFFANAYNVFLLRQYFLTIPREMDEAAMIDGASPLRTLISVILPQGVPGVVAVALFHFFWAWNDFFEPLIYLTSKPDLFPISVGVQAFNAQYYQDPNLIQTTAIMGLALPVILFFIAQRVFMQGVVITGVEK